MPPKIRACTAKIRQGAEHVKCNTPLKGEACSNKENHLLPFPTGFCLSKWCEGTKPRTAAGKPAKTCSFWLTCPCECHDTMTEMFEMSGQERMPVENPEYIPYRSDYWMPTEEDRIAARVSSIAQRAGRSPVDEESLAARASADPATRASAYEPTPTGRAARGQLEARVEEVVREWQEAGRPGWCTPAYIQRVILKRYGTEPSSGAVSAVFDRWEKVGFATQAKKPVRCEGITEGGMKYGYLVLRERARLSKAKSGARR